MKNKIVAGFLALFFGIFGVHRFYLGRRFWGVMHMLLFFFTLALTIDHEGPFIIAPAILGFIDAILLFAMPVEDFDDRYNAKFLKKRQQAYYARQQHKEEADPEPEFAYRPKAKPSATDAFLKRIGVEKFRSGDFLGAIEAFSQVLEEEIDSPAAHFNLACCYSMLHDAPSAFEHLEKAVVRGFSDFNRIHQHAALHFLRSQPGFETFVANGYKRTRTAPAEMPQKDTPLNSTPSKETQQPTQVIDEIFHLGELMEKGLLSEEEFQREKKKLLSD
ncbi:MAG: NINE protein [Haliscomenobacter sp.]|nr:NINE protein [Haliscomenobacter sp.]